MICWFALREGMMKGCNSVFFCVLMRGYFLLLLGVCWLVGKLVNASCAYQQLEDLYGITANYDLSSFILDDGVFEVDISDSNLKYKFNICNEISSTVYSETIPSFCNISEMVKPCVKFSGMNCSQMCTESNDEMHPSAIEINTANEECVWMGMVMSDVYNMSDYKIELIDEYNTGRGVLFTIYNGAYCSEYNTNRELTVKLICPHQKEFAYAPSDATTVTETLTVDDCSYEVSYRSVLACPVSCIEKMGELYIVCSGNGVCASDPMTQSVRCLCDDNYSGTYCADYDTSLFVIKKQTHTALIAVIVICSILLVVALVLSAFLCHKIRMKKAEDEALMATSFITGMLNEENDAQVIAQFDTSEQKDSMNRGGDEILLTSTESKKKSKTATTTNIVSSLDEQIAIDVNNEEVDEISNLDIDKTTQ